MNDFLDDLFNFGRRSASRGLRFAFDDMGPGTDFQAARGCRDRRFLAGVGRFSSSRFFQGVSFFGVMRITSDNGGSIASLKRYTQEKIQP